ncbi:hypothetical protein FOMG_19905 [Fusarium oxysporum f. sp. melonis 26406]|uniref:Uncharacterized protein n=1 Tax=Fusarium oxysporum f. sp. melonis 26406 TaxID=1089452 RepID=W9YUR3_FUSOX|nr:hypothetical protein FOMG_19905 [Fusarium oxysporum f. sp. melonis 26406]
MVEHQRRSHQYGMNPDDVLRDCSSDSEDDEPPTSQHSAMTWSPRDIGSMDQAIPHGPIHRASSYAYFNQEVNDQHIPQQYANQHGILLNVSQEFHGQPIPDYYVGASTPRRTTTMPREMYYVTEQGNPEVVTMTNAAQPHYQLPQQVERPITELPCSTLATAASIQSSPRTFSATSFSSPIVQEHFYTYLPKHRPEYVQADSQQSIIQYQQPMQQPMSQVQQGKRSNYDLPIEVTSIGQLPAYGTAVYDFYGPKIEVDDPSMQLPSSRFASL